jgi:hypothetical protein
MYARRGQAANTMRHAEMRLYAIRRLQSKLVQRFYIQTVSSWPLLGLFT